MGLEKRVIQLEFPFTLRGFMQNRAIAQDQFLRCIYKRYINECFGKPYNFKSFEHFEAEDGVYFMKKFAEANPLSYERTRNLIR